MKTIYKGDTRYEKVYEQMQLLGIEDVTTERQNNNGTIVWRLPILSDRKGKYLEYASFASGYVRNQGVDCRSNWQINKRVEGKPEYYELPNGDYRKYTGKIRELIPIEIDRLEYMMKYIIKNEFIKRANTVQTGDFIPKWRYDSLADAARLDYEKDIAPEMPDELTVILNGHRYKVI